MLLTHFAKGLAGLFSGAALALGGLLALFVCMLNAAAGNVGPAAVAGVMTVVLASSGADLIYRAVHGPAAVATFRKTVAVVLSLGVAASALLA